MSRENFTSKWWIVPHERVDPWKHEDGSSPGCDCLLSSRTLRCGNHDRIFISWQNYFLGSYRERNQQIRNRNVIKNSCCKCCWQRYRETCREGQTTADGQGCFEVSKFMISLLWRDESVHREEDGAVRFDDLAELFKSRFEASSHWSIQAWIIFMAKGGRQKKMVQHCLNPFFSEHVLYFRAIQGHSGGTLVDPTLQDNVLWTDDFAEHIYHVVGNAHEMQSIIQCGLIPGGKRLKRDRQSVFFTSVNPMYTYQHQKEVQYDLDKTQNCGVQKYLEHSPKYSVLVQFETHSKKRIAVLSNTIQRNRSFQHFTCDMYWESGIHADWRRVILHGRQDLSNPDARTSADHQSKQIAKNEETCTGNVDYRIQGVPHSAVKKEHSNRKEMVTRLIQQFETHPNRDSLIEDLIKTEEFNPSANSRRSWSLAWVTRSTSSCARSNKTRCLDWSLNWEVGIEYCTCGKCMQPSERNRQLNKARYVAPQPPERQPLQAVDGENASYMDDEAVYFMHRDHQHLVQWVTRASQIYNDTCGLTLNFAPGKSEAMVALRGKGAPLAREQAEAGLKIGPNCTLSVVRQYLNVALTSFTCALMSSVTVSTWHVRTLPQGPWVSKQNGVFILVITSGCTH